MHIGIRCSIPNVLLAKTLQVYYLYLEIELSFKVRISDQ